LPVAVIAVVDSRIPAARARALQQALLTMAHAAGGADALQVLQLTGFVSPQLPPYTAAP
jgi:ABC-type phosphate/phosphonate transport system substrate-binding protein